MPVTNTQKRENEAGTMSGDSGCGKPGESDIQAFRSDLLGWYDRHRRVLPWRAGAGVTPDPYHVWLSEIMLQQTVVAAVIPYFQKFVDKWPTVHDLAAARQEDVMQAWAGLGYYARARNLHKCAKVVSEELSGVFPDDLDGLKKLPGIGDYTSAAIMAIAFDKPATVVDGNVERVVARYFAVTRPVPDAKPLLREKAAWLSADSADRPGDFAQAMMDLGATICIPKAPRCALCPVNENCLGREQGIAADLPARRAKKAKPQKVGHVYWITDGAGAVLCETRPETGMLGGMMGLPTSEWVEKGQNPAHVRYLDENTLQNLKSAKVKHSFTHFDLELRGHAQEVDASGLVIEENMVWVEAKNLKNIGFPTLFKKFVKLMLQDKVGVDKG